MLTILTGDLSFTKSPEFWVAMAFFGFVGLLLYHKVPALIGKALDARAIAIRNRLDEASRLREDAQALLADYGRKREAAEDEAKSIVEQARREAEALSAETCRNLQEILERHTKLAEEKIASAETHAMAAVRASIVELAVHEAEKILREKMRGSLGAQLIQRSVRDLRNRLN